MSAKTAKTHAAAYLGIAFIGLMIVGLNSCWSLYLADLEKAFSCSRSSVSQAHMICTAFFAFGAIISGQLNNMWRSRNVWLLGTGVLFTGYFFLSRARSLWQVWLFYGVFVGLGNGMVYNTIFGATVLFFKNASNRATSVLMFTFGLSGTVLSPVIAHFLGIVGWRNVFLVVSCCAAAMFLLLLVLDPRESGIAEIEKSDERILDAPRVLGIPFLRFFIWYTAFSTVSQMFVGFAAACGADIHATEIQSSRLVSIFSIVNAVTRLSMASIYTRLGYRRTMRLISACGIFACVLIAVGLAVGNLWILTVASVFFGFGYGAVNLTSPLFIRDFYGPRSYALHLSIASMQSLPVAILSTVFMNASHASSGSYIPAFGLMVVLGVCMQLQVSKIRRKPE